MARSPWLKAKWRPRRYKQLGRVIKSNSIPNASVSHEAVYLLDCEAMSRRSSDKNCVSPHDEAQMILSQAREEAARIVSDAQAEADNIRMLAYEEGRQAALQELEEQKSLLIKYREELESNVENQLEQFWIDIEPELLKLAVKISEKILRREFNEHQDYVLTTVKSAISQLRDKKNIKIRINPSDYEFLRTNKDELVSAFDGVSSLEVIEDRRVDQGGCVIESANGDLDARVSTQLEQVERALLEECHGH